MRRVLLGLVPVLLVVLMVARVWVARAEKEERERMMASLLAHQAEVDRELSAKEQERISRVMREERQRDLAKLEELGRAIQVPKPLTLSTSPGAGLPPEPESPRWDWNATPHSMWVSYADLSKAAVSQARSEECVSTKARKSLVARLVGIHDRLSKALAGAERFPDATVVRAELAEAEAALSELDGALEPTSVHGRMARENLGDLLGLLRAVPSQ